MTAALRRVALSPLGLCFVVALAAPPRPAYAQVEKPPRLFHGLFGAPAPDPNKRESFDLSLSTFEAWDDDVLADQPGRGNTPDVNGRPSGTYSGLTAGADYTRNGHHVDAQLSAGANVRYYPELSDVAPVGYQAGAGISAHSDATKLSLHTNATYYPFFTMGLIPVAVPEGVGEAPHQSVDSVLLRRAARSFGGGVTFDHTFTPRSSFTLTANANDTSFTTEASTYNSWTAGGHYSYHLTKDLGLRAGYGFTRSSYPNAIFSRLEEHNIDSGLDFSKALGKTRKTRIHASGGASIFELPDRRVYRATADAGLLREIGRTWAAQVNYHRGLGVGIGLNAPVFEDSLFTEVQGSLTRRLDLSVNAGYSRGQLGLYTVPNPFNTYSGSARLRFAFSQIFAVYAEYVAYQYEFANRTYLPPSVSTNLRRNGVRSGLTMWLPLYR